MIAINTKMPKSCWRCKFCYDNKGYYCAINNNLLAYSIVDIPSERPSNCPLVEIITCEDCKYWHDDGITTTCDKNIGHGFPKDHYCADAERKE